MNNTSEIVFYKPDESVHLKVMLEQDTVWLTLDQMALLFGRDKSTVSRHIKNIFNEKELLAAATVAKFATVQSESGRLVERQIEHYRPWRASSTKGRFLMHMSLQANL